MKKSKFITKNIINPFLVCAVLMLIPSIFSGVFGFPNHWPSNLSFFWAGMAYQLYLRDMK